MPSITSDKFTLVRQMYLIISFIVISDIIIMAISALFSQQLVAKILSFIVKYIAELF
jgi:hypothetical protein